MVHEIKILSTTNLLSRPQLLAHPFVIDASLELPIKISFVDQQFVGDIEVTLMYYSPEQKPMLKPTKQLNVNELDSERGRSLFRTHHYRHYAHDDIYPYFKQREVYLSKFL